MKYSDNYKCDIDQQCPSCGHEFDYDTADGIPDGYSDIIECEGCGREFNVIAEPSITWSTFQFAHVKVTKELKHHEIGEILLTPSSKGGSICCDGVNKYHRYKIANIDGFYEVPAECVEWLGYPEVED